MHSNSTHVVTKNEKCEKQANSDRKQVEAKKNTQEKKLKSIFACSVKKSENL